MEDISIGKNKPYNSLVYGASIVSILLSLFLVRRNPVIATFTGLWAPTIIGFAVLLKENKILELERKHREETQHHLAA